VITLIITGNLYDSYLYIMEHHEYVNSMDDRCSTRLLVGGYDSGGASITLLAASCDPPRQIFDLEDDDTFFRQHGPARGDVRVFYTEH